MGMRVRPARSRNARCNDEGRSVPPLRADGKSGLADAAMRVGETQIRRRLLVVRIAGVITPVIMGDLLCPDRPIRFEVSRRHGAILDSPGIAVSDAAGETSPSAAAAGGHRKQMHIRGPTAAGLLLQTV